jgi:hypothetical protein
MAVLGGAGGENAATAIADAQSFNDPNIIRVGVGSVVDDELGTLSTSQLAPRIAGILAFRGESKSLTFARLAGVSEIIGGAGASDRDRAIDGGLIVLGRDTQPVPIRLGKAVTTYSVETDESMPVEIFSNPKFVRTMHAIENEFTDFAESPGVIGELPVNDKTRNFLQGELEARLTTREESQILQPGWSVAVDQDPPPSDDDEFVAYRLGLKFSRSTEQIYFSIKAG